MTRAEARRKLREEEKAKTATYNLTSAQLDAMIQERIGKQLQEAKREATEEAINAAMVLLLTLPLEVLMDHYWKKTYAKKIPEFVQHVLDYYEAWQDGQLDMEELKQDLWEYGGIRLEEGVQYV